MKFADPKSNIAFNELLNKARSITDNAWVRYLVYRDLRSRGYVVREGFGLGVDFRVYKRGQYGKSTADYLILGIQEGQPITVENLSRILRGILRIILLMGLICWML